MAPVEEGERAPSGDERPEPAAAGFMALWFARLRAMLASLRLRVSSITIFFSFERCESVSWSNPKESEGGRRVAKAHAYLPFHNEASKFMEEVSSRVLIGGVFSIECHDILKGSIHLVKIEPHLLRFPPSIFHGSLDNLTHPVVRVELLGVAEVAGVERHLHVADIVDIFLCVDGELLDIDLLGGNDTTNVFDEAFPFRILVANNAFDEISKCRLILFVFHHGEAT